MMLYTVLFDTPLGESVVENIRATTFDAAIEGGKERLEARGVPAPITPKEIWHDSHQQRRAHVPTL